MATATYADLLSECVPRPIRSAREHERALAVVEQLMDKPRPTAAEKDLIELFATLIDQFEEQNWPTPEATPGEVLKFLLGERSLSQSELARQAGIPQSTIANVISGRRTLSKGNVLTFAKFFGVSPMLFLSE